MSEGERGPNREAGRREDARLLSGHGRFVDDLRFPGQAFAAFLRAETAHALVRSVDVSAARRAPGVLAAFAAADVVALGLRDIGPAIEPPAPLDHPPAPVLRPHLARERVRFVGEALAMVVAETAVAAEHALSAVRVDATALGPVPDAETAGGDAAPDLHEAAPGNLAFRWSIGDAAAVEAALGSASRVVRVRVESPRLAACALEPRAVNAAYDAATGRYTLHVTGQGVHGLRERLALQLGLPPDRLRVLTPDVGGAFGAKLAAYPEYALCAVAARRIGRPVAWRAGRREAFLTDGQGRGAIATVEAGFDVDARLVAVRLRQISDLGAYYGEVGPGVHTGFSAALGLGLYRADALRVETTGVFTSRPPMDAYRGAGRPEAIAAVERAMEAAATAFGVEPGALRLANLWRADELPRRTATGLAIDSGAPDAVAAAALRLADAEGRVARRRAAEARGLAFGVGVAVYVERAGGKPSEAARVRLGADGRATVHIGTQSAGQGHETAWARIVAQKLGLDPAAVDTAPADSDALPSGGGTQASRSLAIGHRALMAACDALIEAGRSAAAARFGVSAAAVGFLAAAGRYETLASGSLTLAEAAAAAGGALEGAGAVEARAATFPYGAHVAEVTLDPETGVVRLTRYTGVDDVGAVLDAAIVEGQLAGGVAQGVGQALFEVARVDPATGAPLATGFGDYAVPRAADFPWLRLVRAEGRPATTNPLGVKGCGEAGALAAAPAVVHAAHDALRALGVVDPPDQPLTPEKVWRAITAARR